MALPDIGLGVCIATAGLLLLWSLRRRSMVSKVRGPPSPSWIVGHEQAYRNQDQVGDLEFQWVREYGAVFRLKGVFGEDALMVADPKAIHHILHVSGYGYPKATIAQRNVEELFGHGILTAKGAAHARQRKIMNPAFSHGQLKTFTRLFQLISGTLTEQMVELVGTTGSEAPINLHTWLGRVTLDTIGRAGFGYDFGSLKDSNNELAHILHNIFVDSVPPGIYTHVADWMWGRAPGFVRKLIEYFPTKKTLRFNHFQNRSKAAAKEILEGAKDQTDFMSGKDILSVLMRANESEDAAKRLNEEEVLGQASTMILAGHETSASTLSWTFYELSRHQDIQSAIRSEINEIRSRYPDKGEIPTHEYENMAVLNAVLKETLRMHPIIPIIFRMAGQDDVIPLAEPVVTSTGASTTEIPIPKGQNVHIAIHAYNRNRYVWGEDADIWRPERWLEKRNDNASGVTVGVLNNIMSFSAGVRSCIGWRFAMIEMQVFVFELLENFRFEAAKGDVTIKRQPAGSAMLPMVREQMREGIQMPLRVVPL